MEWQGEGEFDMNRIGIDVKMFRLNRGYFDEHTHLALNYYTSATGGAKEDCSSTMNIISFTNYLVSRSICPIYTASNILISYVESTVHLPCFANEPLNVLSIN